jgi:hypothetical protein
MTAHNDRSGPLLPEALLTPSQTGKLLGVSDSWLAKARLRGDGPRYVKVGRSVRYPRSYDSTTSASGPEVQPASFENARHSSCQIAANQLASTQENNIHHLPRRYMQIHEDENRLGKNVAVFFIFILSTLS